MSSRSATTDAARTDKIAPAVLREYPDLDSAKQRIIAHDEGPLLVIAGPGSGKTFSLVLRTLNLLLLERVQPSEVIVCTFTEKAAFELRDRISQAARKVGYTADLTELRVGTIHSICNRILREFRHRTPLGASYETLDDLTELLFVFDEFDEIIGDETTLHPEKWSTKWRAIEGMRKYFDKVTEELIDPTALESSTDPFVSALARAYRRYLEKAAVDEGYEFRGRKKGSGEGHYEGRFIEATDSNDAMLDPELQLLAGTSWLFAREELDQHVDTLFVDEGGQFALADAIAVGTAARNLVLLGDPNQLPQVSQGSHPPGAEASVLGHLLGDDETVPPDRGLFLEHTWRMRPEVNAYVSETFYEGRLEPAEVTSTRSIVAGNGVRFLAVPHQAHSQASPEEAAAVRAEIERLVGTPYVEAGVERPLRYDDFIVVAPYNAHVRLLREQLPEAVRVGTVDKFQGQQATVSFFAMASSSGEDVPRGLDFLFSRNRLNVAVSRAKCLAYVVASPRLLETSCKTVEQMRLVNALCRFVEMAEADPGPL